MADFSCKKCAQQTASGIQCDNCSNWWCPDCINGDEVIVTYRLYHALMLKGEFNWQCKDCSSEGIYQQLLQSGTFSKNELIKYGCNQSVIADAESQIKAAETHVKGIYRATAFPSHTPGQRNILSNSLESLERDNVILRNTNALSGNATPCSVLSTTNSSVFPRVPASGDPSGIQSITRLLLASQEQQRQAQAHQNQFMQQMMAFQTQTQQALMETQQQVTHFIQNVSSSFHGQNNQQNNRFAPQENVVQSVASLPKMQLATFSGDMRQWPNFWESFEINVHSQNLHDKQKLDYLHQLLKGTAFDKIKGLGLEGSNYEEAVFILKQHYGNPMFQRKALWDAFHSLPSVRDNLCNLEKFTDEARAIINCITRQGTSKEVLNVLVPELIKKLPVHLVTEMNKMRMMQQRTAFDITVDELLEFLRQYMEIQNLSCAVQNKTSYVDQPVSARPDVGTKLLPTANFNLHTNSTDRFRQCVFCREKSHYSDECKKVPKVSDRKTILIRERRCFNCLGNSHVYRDCQRRKECFYCAETDHHASLCQRRIPTRHGPQLSQQLDMTDGSPEFEDQLEAVTNATVNASINVAASKTTEGIVMAAFPCKVINPSTNQAETLYVYADGGAKVTCISEAAARKLNLRSRKTVSLAVSRFNADDVDLIKADFVKAQLNGPNGFKLNVEAYAVSKTAPAFKVGPISLNNDGLKIVRKLKPINRPPQCEVEHPIDILIGQDYYNTILGPHISTTNVQHQLYVYHSELGNILCGNSRNNGKVGGSMSMCLLQHEMVGDPMEQLWKLETIGISSPDNPIDSKNYRILQEFNDSVKFENNRYEVAFPWKSDKTVLSSNYQVAKRRLEATLKVLAPRGIPTPEFEAYNAVIQDQRENGVIEEARTKEADGSLKHYIAHFPVIKQNSGTTKVRIVYDASAKTRHEQKSLHDMLHIGPCLLNDLTGILLRFRTYKIAMIADIEKAFLQIGLRPEDRDCTRFLWLKDPKKPATEDNILYLRFTRIPFGVGASPFLLGATVSYHLKKHPTEVGSALARNLYVDNAIVDANDSQEAVEKYKECKTLFDDAFMNLREWISNDTIFNETVPPNDRSTETSAKVLGMMWNTEVDTIQLKQPIKDTCGQRNTKREVVHLVSKWFDPLGLVSPVLVTAKVFIQRLWKLNLEWDDLLPSPEQDEWNIINAQLSDLMTLYIPRLSVMNRKNAVQLCCFTDASESAYATCIYARQQIGQQTTSNLVFAKTRVAPIKPKMTIPRLELTAVVIGCRALNFVAEQCGLPVESFHLWTDSQIVLHWIHSTKELEPYIERRKQEILRSKIHFRYVETKSNPSDLGTRGCTAKQLQKSNWFNGPQWLKSMPAEWLKWGDELICTAQIALSNSKQHSANGPIQNKVQPQSVHVWIQVANKKTDIRSVERIIAYCRRFINAMKKLPVPETLAVTTAENREANFELIKLVQQLHYMDEITLLQRAKSNQLIKRLDLRVTLKDGILRCGGRLGNAFPDETASPILLPKTSRLTDLIITDAHKKVFHFGIKATLAKIRERYWLPRAYSTIRRVLRDCLLCRKVQGSTFTPPKMGPLPAERVGRSPAFKFTGLDYLGPLVIRENKSCDFEKRWIAIFTCFSTRAIHLEIINDCSTDCAIQAILRFIGRRGCPNTLLTDNASQFKKSAEVLTTIWGNQPTSEAVEDLTRFFSQYQINWKFIPEGSPWVGGFYERLVSLVKRALRKTFWRTTINAETLATVLIQLEGVLNTRPLLALESDHNEYMTLTPAHFIAPSTQLSVPPTDEDPDDEDYFPDSNHATLIKQWKIIESKLNQFWKIWQSQYLHELRQLHQTYFKVQKGSVQRAPVKGETCLIKETSPRATWKIARIVDLVPGPDKEIRVAVLRLASGHLTRRGIKDLVPLEAQFRDVATHIAAREIVVIRQSHSAY